MITTFNGIENAGDAPEDGAEDCEHEFYAWIGTAARCESCGLELSGTRLDPRYDAHPKRDRDIPPGARLIAWAGEIPMGTWTGTINQRGIQIFADCVRDELDFAGAAPPGVEDLIVIRLVEGGKPGRIVYRDGGVVR